MSPPSSQAKATNARGVTVLDVLQAIVRECLVIDSPVLTLRSTNDVTDDMVDLALQGAFTPDGRRRGKWLNKADCLEGFRRYEGLEATRDGLRVNAVARLSSQPVAGEFFGPKRDPNHSRVLKSRKLEFYILSLLCILPEIRDFLVRSLERKMGGPELSNEASMARVSRSPSLFVVKNSTIAACYEEIHGIEGFQLFAELLKTILGIS
ncbi:hypothetical protein B0H13DRAFT_2340628 [Mycena leptocephala]|nr:hypothetical protein B0H13DRAFT_2340628 [Mycena leptocephala]